MQIDSFHGLLCKEGLPDRSVFDTVSAAMTTPRWSVSQNHTCALGVSTPSPGGKFQVHSSDHFIISGFAELYDRSRLASALGIDGAVEDDVALILECYKRVGADTPRRLEGAFAFCIWNEADQSLFCARDHIGQHPFYYYHDERLTAVSDSLLFLSQFSFAEQLDKDATVELLHENYLTNDTIFKKIVALLPGHRLHTTNGKLSLDKYWKIDDLPVSKGQTFNDAVEGLKWHLSEALRKSIDGSNRIGLELSGGLDSSVIAAFARLLGGKKLEIAAFSNTLPLAENIPVNVRDEWDKASLVAGHLGIQEHDGVNQIEPPLALCDMIVGSIGHPDVYGISMFETGMFEAVRKASAQRLFSGFGGDEGLSIRGVRRYAATLIWQNKIVAALKYYRDLGYDIPRASYITMSELLGQKLGGRNYQHKKLLKQRWQRQLLSDEILDDARYYRSFMSDVFFAAHGVNERTRVLIDHPSTTKRLESSYSIAALYGVSYQYPLLDVPLLEYFLKIPEKLKVGSLRERELFRAICQGMLPTSIIDQAKRGPVRVLSVPALEVIPSRYFYEIKSWLLDLPAHHQLFDYWSRQKLEALQKGSLEHEGFLRYKMLVCGVLFAMFIDKRKGIQLHEI